MLWEEWMVGQWTWLHQMFPLADIELVKPPIDAKIANVLVRTVRELPEKPGRYQVRVAPHNVAPFRGGPWTGVFDESDLSEPGIAMAKFREGLAREISRVTRVRE